jgi:exopolysaccharide biosynthesis polyprenyl glycosylphosphotransferase
MNLKYRTKQFILSSGDFFSFLLAFWISNALRYMQIPELENLKNQFGLFSFIFILWIVVNYINGLYDLTKISNNKRTYRRLLEAGSISLFISITFFYLLPQTEVTPKTLLILNILFGYSISILWRLLYNKKIIGTKKLRTNIILVGYSKETKELINIINKNPERGYKISTIIDPTKKIKSSDYKNINIYYGLHTIRPAISTNNSPLVVISPNIQKDTNAIQELYQLLFWNVQITDLSSFYENITGRIMPSVFSDSWFIEHLKDKDQPVYDQFRTLFDYFSGVIIAIIFLILFPFVAIAIKLTSKGPVFFKQDRIGKNGSIFTIFKFRTMTLVNKNKKIKDSIKIRKKDQKRITSVGKFLRKTRIDELPQFINLLKRELTLIGPRPECPELEKEFETELPYYSLRHIVRPGITGWAVLHQGHTNTMDECLKKLQYDLYYIKNRSFLLDLSILLKTVNVILRFMGQ